MNVWTDIVEFFQNNPNAEKALWAAIGSLSVAFVLWLLRGLRQAPTAFFRLALAGRFWVVDPYESVLQRYRERLDEDTFRIHHAWMKEGQTLGDILVPVVVDSEGEVGGIENLPVALAQIFDPEKEGVPRLVVIGGPGSGKSVALRVAARRAWNWPAVDGKTRVPVLITFSEYRDADFDLVKALAKSLLSRGLHPPKGPDGGELARLVVEEYLNQGRLVVLVDALDELEFEDRNRAARQLSLDLKTYAKNPAIVSCRKAAWKGQIKSPERQVIKMADFTPAAIREFVRKWQFQAPKSSEELLKVITTQAHVGELARTPLMLTIITFLYSQPKYRLPENRAQFYEVCTRALLEEWDQAQNPDRANSFDRPHKEHLLGRLAYEHMNGPNPAKDIEESTALTVFGEGMQEDLGLKRSENAKMLEEIVVNSGLLGRLPPSGLRFPHQTFLEYFAALHILRTQPFAKVLAHYHDDPARWREVVLLYCGLSTNIEENVQILDRFLESDTVEMALAALTDIRTVREAVASQVLDAAEKKLSEDPTVELLSNLGYVSANLRTSYAVRAGDILQKTLVSTISEEFPPQILHELLLAALRRPTTEPIHFVIDNADRLDLGRILPEMKEDGLILASRILNQSQVSLAKKRELIDGLRRAKAVHLLFEILQVGDISELESLVGVALAKNSKTAEFWESIENVGDIMPNRAEAEKALRRWTWPFETPRTQSGKVNACAVARLLAKNPSAIKHDAVDIHPWVLFLAKGLHLDGNFRILPWQRAAPLIDRASPFALRTLWKKSTREGWKKWIGRHEARTDLWGWLGVGGGMLLHLWMFVAVILHVFGSDAGVPWPFPLAYLGGVVSLGLIAALITNTDAGDDRNTTLLVVMLTPLALPTVVVSWTTSLWGRSLVLCAAELLTLGVIVSLWLFTPLSLLLKVAGCLVFLGQFLFWHTMFGADALVNSPILANEGTNDLLRLLNSEGDGEGKSIGS